MTQSASATFLRSEFDAFLFASVGDDKNGMALSVVSALARVDVDPWQEAAELAALPGDSATQRLSSLIARLPDRVCPPLIPAALAARLVALLPHRTAFAGASEKSPPSLAAVTQSQVVKYMLIMGVVMVTQYFLASHRAPGPVDNVHSSATSSLAPLASSPDLRR